MKPSNDREAWLTDAGNIILNELLSQYSELPARPWRVSVGVPGSRGGGVIGVCWPSARSEDGTNEIFITPAIDETTDILSILIHELIHYLDDCQSGHKGEFKRVSKAVGFRPPLTKFNYENTTQKFKDYVGSLASFLGPFPHAKLDLKSVKKQKIKMKKLLCGECGFSARTTEKFMVNLNFPACCPNCEQHFLIRP